MNSENTLYHHHHHLLKMMMYHWPGSVEGHSGAQRGAHYHTEVPTGKGATASLDRKAAHN